EDSVRFARPEQIAGRRVPAPTAGLTQGLCLSEKGFAPTDFFLGLLSLDALPDRVGYRSQRFRRGLTDGCSREYRQNAHPLAAREQGKSGKSHHALDASPVTVAQMRIVDDVVRDIGCSLLGDAADVQVADRNETMRTIDVRVHSCAGFELEESSILRRDPDAGECGAYVLDDAFEAGLKHPSQGVVRGQRQAHVSPNGH